jgi:hypothetical protein
VAQPIAGQGDVGGFAGVGVALDVVPASEHVAVVTEAALDEPVQAVATQAHAQGIVVRTHTGFDGHAPLHFLRGLPLARPLLRMRRGRRQSPGQQRRDEAARDPVPHGPPDVTPHRFAITRRATVVNAQPSPYPFDMSCFRPVLLLWPQRGHAFHVQLSSVRNTFWCLRRWRPHGRVAGG